MTIDRDKYFQGGKFLKAADVKDGATFTVEKFEDITTRIGLRPILRLVGVEMPFGLNATNLDKMVEKFGDNETKWAGKKIRIVHVMTQNPSAGNKATKGLRIA
jgi:hypothetical protein